MKIDQQFKCRICGSQNYSLILKTETPLAADVSDEITLNQKRFPLDVVVCDNCGHVQLKETLDASFYGEYLYTPSYASGFIDYIELFVNRLNDKIQLKDRKVIEVGSSNGYLLDKLQKSGWTVLGVEPSKTLSKISRDKGVPTYDGFFSKDTVGEIKKLIGQPNVLIFRHVMEHLDNLEDIVKAIEEIIGDGLVLIEVPYLKRIIEEKQFYAFFHEHLSYYSVSAFKNLLQKGNLYIHKIYENNLEGGSILISVNNDNRSYPDDNLNKYLEDEKKTLTKQNIINFANLIENSIASIKNIVKVAKERKEKIAAWGAGQRGCTLISMCGFNSSDISYVIDVNKNYWNKYVPGTDIKIVPPESYRSELVNKILIFATGYADSIIKENSSFVENGGEFIKII